MKQAPAIDRAFKDRGLTSGEVARFLNVTPQCVQSWRSGRNRISPTYARLLNEQYELPLHVLRPDVWDPPARSYRRKAA
jgi:DNA-binding transcriptional regulator YiaG